MRWANPYERASDCTGAPATGARALLAWALETYGSRQARSLGIYNCREVRGSSSRSIHSEGRAVDLGLPVGPDGKGIPLGHAIVSQLGAVGDAIGVQSVIYDRRIWSARSPEGRPYGGVHPHRDHLHIELTRRAGTRMTLATFRHHLGGPSAPSEEDSMFCARGDTDSKTVEYWQRLLRRLGHYTARLDGDYGSKTQAAVAAAVGPASTDGSAIGPLEAELIHVQLLGSSPGR